MYHLISLYNIYTILIQSNIRSNITNIYHNFNAYLKKTLR